MAPRAQPGQPQKVKRGAYATCRQCLGRFKLGYDNRDPICGLCRPIDNGVDWKAVPSTWQSKHRFDDQNAEPDPSPATPLTLDQRARSSLEQFEQQPLIVLLDHELEHAVAVGTRRQDEAINRRLKNKYGFKGDPYEVHVEGACGEYAVAKALGVPWEATVNTFREADVAGYEVKTRSEQHYGIIVRPDTDPDDAFMLAIGHRPVYRVCGWISGREARRTEWWKTYGDRPGAWFVPQRALHPIRAAPIPWDRGVSV
jgi:hypothetical protein